MAATPIKNGTSVQYPSKIVKIDGMGSFYNGIKTETVIKVRSIQLPFCYFVRFILQFFFRSFVGFVVLFFALYSNEVAQIELHCS